MPTSRVVLLVSAVGIAAVGVALYFSHNQRLAKVAKKRQRRRQRNVPRQAAQNGGTKQTETGPAAWLQQAMDTKHASSARDAAVRDDIGRAQKKAGF